MFRRVAATLLVPMAALAGASPVCADGPSKDPLKAPAGVYQVERPHSQVLFALTHIGLTEYYGRFDRVSGTLTFDPAAPEKSSVSIAIDMSSVDTPSTGLVRELLSSDVFDARTFPFATFKSTAITRTGADTGRIDGELKLHGVTKPVTLDVVFNGVEANPIGTTQVMGFHATTTLKRTDFGIQGMDWEPLVGDDVKLTIEVLFEQEPH
jgi:polyisoprenoid-binding protein YceI